MTCGGGGCRLRVSLAIQFFFGHPLLEKIEPGTCLGGKYPGCTITINTFKMSALASNTSSSSPASYDFTAISLGRKEAANAAWRPSAAKRAEVAAKRAAAVPLKTRIERTVDKDGFAIEVERVVESDE